MVKKIEVRVCDICHKRKDSVHNIQALSYRTFDGTDGMTSYTSPLYELVNLDVCNACKTKITTLHSVGVQCDSFEVAPMTDFFDESEFAEEEKEIPQG